MDFLNQIAKQISELFRSMTAGSKIAVGLLLAVLVVLLFFLFSGKMSSSGEYLFAGESFSATQVQKMEGAFGAEGLSGYSAVPAGGGFKVKVEGHKANFINALVKHKALPPNCYDEIEEASNDVGPFTSPTLIKESLRNGKTNMLARKIADMNPLIENVTIMFNKEKPRGFNATEKSSAGIIVKPVPGETLSTTLARSIQQLAAGSLGIPAADITVVDGPTGYCFSGDLNKGDVADQLAESEREVYWKKKIHELIGIGGMTIAVNVKQDPYKSRVTSVYKPNKTDTVAQRMYEKNRSSETQTPATMGRIGLVSNTPRGRIEGAANTTNNNKSEDSETQTKNVFGESREQIVYNTGLEQQVNVSIQIPSEHYAKIWRSQNPTPEGEDPKTPKPEELAAIESKVIEQTKGSVANLLKEEGVKDPSQFVYVTTCQSIAAESVAEPGMMSKAMGWFGKYWTVLGLFVLAIFSLRALRSFMRSVPVEIADSSTAEKQKGKAKKAGIQDDTVSEETAKAMASQMLKKFDGKGPSLRDELTMLVNQDADAAATILRGWIGSPTKT